MGKKLDALLGRGFKAKKFKTTLNLAISRLAVIKNQHQARYSVARSDVIQMLNLGQHERALLLRVEQVIKEQNMLDVFALIETYCYMLKERINLLEQAKECPDELKEAISSMIYAANRCGGFPELQQLRSVYKSRFGKDFVARAVEIRNNCGVSPKMIQKLSTRTPSYQNRMKVLKEIALENNIVLHIEEAESVATEVKRDVENDEDQPMANESNVLEDSKSGVNTTIGTREMDRDEVFTYSMKTGRQYKDVADAARAAFESAAYAATAAKAAVELSRMDSHDSDHPRSPGPHQRMVANSLYLTESKLPTSEAKDSRGLENMNIGEASEKVPVQNYSSESEDDEIHTENKLKVIKPSEKDGGYETSLSMSSLDSADNSLKETIAPSDEGRVINVGFDESDDETEHKSRIVMSGPDVSDSAKNEAPHADEVVSSGNDRNVEDNLAEENKACNLTEEQSQAREGSVEA